MCLLRAPTWVQIEARNAKSVRRIAKWVTGLMEPLDLTPSDSAMALVLVAALQRKRRRCSSVKVPVDVCLLHAGQLGGARG